MARVEKGQNIESNVREQEGGGHGVGNQAGLGALRHTAEVSGG